MGSGVAGGGPCNVGSPEQGPLLPSLRLALQGPASLYPAPGQRGLLGKPRLGGEGSVQRQMALDSIILTYHFDVRVPGECLFRHLPSLVFIAYQQCYSLS